MIFFKPTKKWIDWLVRYADGRIIVDIGCGEGELLKQLYPKYKRLIGIDLYIRDELRLELPEIHLLEINTVENKLTKGLTGRCLFLFCRPCHGYFVQGTLSNLPADAEVLYVGKPSNLTVDIPDDVVAEPLECPRLPEEKVWRLR